jgi:APA family basic amino acid/polyamine antiporter
MVRQLGSAGWLIAMWVLRTITVIAAVSYGELSAMFPKAGGQYILRRHMENSLVFYTVVSLP